LRKKFVFVSVLKIIDKNSRIRTKMSRIPNTARKKIFCEKENVKVGAHVGPDLSARSCLPRRVRRGRRQAASTSWPSRSSSLPNPRPPSSLNSRTGIISEGIKLYFVFCRLYQCCGSGILISDPGSRFLSVPDPDFFPSRIPSIKERSEKKLVLDLFYSHNIIMSKKKFYPKNCH